MVINQVNDIYQTRHPRMRAYRNELWDMFGSYFTEHVVKAVPRSEKTIADALDVIAGIFRTPMDGLKTHEVHIRNRPSIP